MKTHISHYYDITPVVDYKGFAELFIICSAKYNEKGEIIATIPNDFKEVLEEMMYTKQEKGLIKVAKLIDPLVYYDRQLVWEEEINRALNDYVNDNEKINVKYDFNNCNVVLKLDRQYYFERRKEFDNESFETMVEIVDYIEDNTKVYNRNELLKEKDRENIIKSAYPRG